MLSNIRKRKEQGGFTLIEVMIVLAIAGLILLVVFLAVPALQRNARNTNRREDVGNLLSAVSEYTANNNGAIPAVQGAGTAGTASYTIGASGTNQVTVPLGYYDGAGVTIVAFTAGNSSTEDNMIVMRGAKCNGALAEAGSARSVAVLFTLETGAKQCRAS